MKQKQIALLLLCIAALAILGWHIAYRAAKNADNLPSLEQLQTEDLAALRGYRRTQLCSVWGEPQESGEGQDIWALPARDDSLLVTYDAKERVTEAAFVIE